MQPGSRPLTQAALANIATRDPVDKPGLVTIAVPLLIALLLVAGAPVWATSAVLLALGTSCALLAYRGVHPDGRWLATTLILVSGVGVSLLPLPASVASIVAPGRLAAEPAAAWSANADFEATLTELALVVGLASFGTLVAATFPRGLSRARLGDLATLVGATVIALTTSHAVFGAQRVLSVVPVQHPRAVMFLPFVNNNHLAAFLVLLVGPIVGSALRGRRAAMLVAAAIGITLAVLGSASGLVAGSLVVTAVCVGHARFLGLGVAPLSLGAAGIFAHTHGLHGRLGHHRDALHLGLDHWLLGAGGNWDLAMAAYRTDTSGRAWGHAHSDPLEWIVQTGLVGTIALGVAAWTLLPRDLGREPADYGLAGLLLMSLVEFPLQIPVIAMTAVAVVAVRRPSRGQASPRHFAWLALALWLGAGWTAREALADAAEGDRPELLHLLAPWRPAAGLALAPGDAEAARETSRRHYGDGVTVARAALILGRLGHSSEALELTRRGVERAPADHRTWVALARASQAAGDQDNAVVAWTAAFERGASTDELERALDAVPIPLVWLDALKNARPALSIALARHCTRSGDHLLAAMAWDQVVLLAGPKLRFLPAHATALERAGRLDEALLMRRRAALTGQTR